MKKRLLLLLAMIMTTLITAACGASASEETGAAGEEAAETITVEHDLGTAEVKKNPEKVVVFDFGVLDSLDKLGVEVAGVPQANIPTYLSKYEDAAYENVGGLKEPDFEKIDAMEPDLIIISGRQQEAYEELNSIAPTVYMAVDTANYMESFKHNATTLGEIFGKEAEVEEEIAKVEEAIAGIEEKTAASEENGLVILVNEGNISAYGPGSRFGIIHDVFGLTPVDEKIEVSTHGQNVSFEYLVEQDPDYLFVVDRGAVVEGESSAQQTLENELVEKTKAYQNGNIIYLNPDYWYLSGGGLTSVPEMVKEIEAGIE